MEDLGLVDSRHRSAPFVANASRIIPTTLQGLVGGGQRLVPELLERMSHALGQVRKFLSRQIAQAQIRPPGGAVSRPKRIRTRSIVGRCPSNSSSSAARKPSDCEIRGARRTNGATGTGAFRVAGQRFVGIHVA